MKPKQLTVLLLVITANIKREIKLRPIQLHPSSPGHGKLPRTAPDFHGIFSGLEHRGKLDGNADLQAFAQTVERVSYKYHINPHPDLPFTSKFTFYPALP